VRSQSGEDCSLMALWTVSYRVAGRFSILSSALADAGKYRLDQADFALGGAPNRLASTDRIE
jgi:hypothetical protein